MFPLHSIVMVKTKTLTELDIVMMLKQRGAEEAGSSLQLTSLFCQHRCKKLQWKTFSIKLLFCSVHHSSQWDLHFLLTYCSA